MRLRISIASAGGQGVQCVYCREPLADSESVRCSGCRVRLHLECRDELSRCPTIGCADGRWSDREPVRRRPRRRTGRDGPVIGHTVGPEPGRLRRILAAMGGGAVALALVVAGVIAFGSGGSILKSLPPEDPRIAKMFDKLNGPHGRRLAGLRDLDRLEADSTSALIVSIGKLENPEHRRQGIATLVKLANNTRDVRETLLWAMTQEEPACLVAADVFGAMGPVVNMEEVGEGLAQLYRRKSPTARSHALIAMIRIDPSAANLRKAVTWVKSRYPRTGDAVADALSQLDGAAGPATIGLITILKTDARARVRSRALVALRGCGDSAREVSVAIESAAQNDEDPAVRRAARTTLARLGLPLPRREGSQ